MSLSKNLQKCHSLNRILSYLWLWSNGMFYTHPGCSVLPWLHPHEGITFEFRLNLYHSVWVCQEAVSGFQQKGCPLTCVSFLVAFSQSASCYLGRKLSSCAEGWVLCVLASLAPTPCAQYVSRKKNQSGCRRIIHHSWQICANGSLENTAPNHFKMHTAKLPKLTVVGTLKSISTDFKGQNDTKHILLTTVQLG